MKKLLILCVLGASPLVSASSQQELDGISEQLPILWQDYRPLCEAGFTLNSQLALGDRLLFLDDALGSTPLNNRFKQAQRQIDITRIWAKELWANRWQQEQAALVVNQREALRDYLFKLQEQKPSGERETLVRNIAQHALRLNVALREGIWKSCYALDKHTQGVVLESELEEHWQQQKTRVTAQVERELSAYYFYAFRLVPTASMREYAKLEANIQSWTDLMEGTLRSHFMALRNEMAAIPFNPVETVAGPSLEVLPPLQ